MCNNASTVEDIIKYNNTQNKIEASDFRSNDSIQQRLRNEFRAKFPNIKYYGARRGHNIIRRTPPDLIPSESAAQALVAFHIDPIIAYHEKTKIWIDNKLYSKVFNENTSAEHIVFVYSLLKSIERIKIDLVNKKDSEGDEENKNKLSDAESNYLTFLRNRGAKFLLLTAIAECLETIIGEKIPNSFRLGFKKVEYLDEAINSWLPIVRSVLPFHRQLSEALKDGLKSKENVKRSITNFCSMVESMCYATPNLPSFKEFREKIVY
ncbi:AIPR family protein [Calditerricola satsumensis]|nr:AIPR family protein [Calditerricola satsumensis]